MIYTEPSLQDLAARMERVEVADVSPEAWAASESARGPDHDRAASLSRLK
jgi:hypothetical protein